MQYLMVLFLIIGIIVLMIAAILGISYGIGMYLNNREGARADPSNKDPCAQCQADREWYEGLPIWQQNVVTAWWLVNRYQWTQKGCQ
jgi:hypothetical protein